MKKYLLCVVITILFVACDSTNDLGTPFTKGQEVTLTAIIGEQRPQLLPGKQRVSGVDAGEKINLVWDNGDKILVKVDDHSAEFTLSGGAGTGEGTFTGIMPADGTSFHVEYPIDYSDDVLKVQQYVPNGFGKGLMKISTKKAGTIDNGFTLSADNALLGLQLTGNRKIGKIVLSRNNSAGKVGDESYTLLCPNVVLTAEPTLFYIVVLPGTWANGFTVEVIANDNSVVIDRFVKTSSITFGTDNAIIMPEKNVQPEPEYVDLGLSVKWATFNVGASKPEDYGDYFAWGETEPKETYSWATYKWCDGTDANITKYNSTDGKTILEPADDAAQVHWGGKWRMPTKEEIEELIDNCTWSESIQNGVKGYVITSKHTGNSIFFPYSGYFNHDHSATLQGEKTLFYTWSAEHSDKTRAYDINNRTGAILLEQNTRRCGFPIRPVYDDRVK